MPDDTGISHSDDVLPPAREIKLKNPWVGVGERQFVCSDSAYVHLRGLTVSSTRVHSAGCAATIGALVSMIYASQKVREPGCLL
jgi:hypothetical protein